MSTKHKAVGAVRNEKTGSYTVYVPKDARAGGFSSSTSKPTGRIVVRRQSKKAS